MKRHLGYYLKQLTRSQIYNKTTILRVGTINSTKVIYFPENKFCWTSTSAKTLGITFYNDTNMIPKNNLEPNLNEFKNCLKQWQHRKLTSLGKTTVIKTFALPQMIYPLSVLSNPPESVLSDINSSIFKFIWDNKPERIKINRLKLPFDMGGLNIPDIFDYNRSLKAGWVKRYLDTHMQGKWEQLLKDKLQKYGNNLIFESNLTDKDIHIIFKNETLIKDIISAWSNINIRFQKHGRNNNNSYKTILWYNSDIRIDYCSNNISFLRN